MSRHKSRKIIQTYSPEKEKPVQPLKKKDMLPTPSSSTSSSSTIGIIGNTQTRVVPKSAVRLSLNTTAALPLETPYPTSDVTSAAPKSYASATAPTTTTTTAAVWSSSPPPRPMQQDQEEHQVPMPVSSKVDVDPTRNVQHYLQRDRTEFEPFATVCILAIRFVVPGSKLVVVPPLLSLDRNPSLIRAVSSYLWSGMTQDVIYLLLKPLKRAIELYLRSETLHIFRLAEAGLKSLQEIYKNSNAELSLQQMVTCLQESYAPGKPLPTDVPAVDEPFSNLWHSSEISAISAMFLTVNAVGLVNKDNAVIWTAALENTLKLKLGAYV
jgi:hypothetical protein